MNYNDPVGADFATRLLSLPIAAMRATVKRAPPIRYMPDNTLQVPEAALLLAATPDGSAINADTIGQVACEQCCDVMLIRSGHHPELLDSVTVDVALRYQQEALVIPGMTFFRHADEGLWLLPPDRKPFLELTPAGLRLEMLSPFLDPDERSDGLCRAARDIVRLARARADPFR